MSKIIFEVNNCLGCKHCNGVYAPTADSFEEPYDYFCGATGKKIASYIERDSEMPDVPEWCPHLLKDDSEVFKKGVENIIATIKSWYVGYQIEYMISDIIKKLNSTYLEGHPEAKTYKIMTDFTLGSGEHIEHEFQSHLCKEVAEVWAKYISGGVNMKDVRVVEETT